MTRTELVTILLIALGVWALVQFTGLKFWQAVVVFAAGFYLASTAAGAQLSATASALLKTLGH